MLRKCKTITKAYFQEHPVLKKHLSLLDKVKNTFSPEDDVFFLKAPGRVNLIGEHTDYNNGPVLPCAIDKEIVFCVRPITKPEINAINVSDQFESVEFLFDSGIAPYPKGHWGNYVKAGVKGVLDFVESTSPGSSNPLNGFEIVVSGTLPLAAGVSSSSALVVASALTFVLVNNLDLSKRKIAEICADAEHFVGTSGGGMDQAASLLGKQDSFLKMEFNPLRIEQINAPKGIQLVLFHSLVEAEKSGKARLEYNRRVLECRMGVDLFNRFMRSEPGGDYPAAAYIGEIKPELFNRDQNKLDQLIERFLKTLPDTYSTPEFTDAMALSETELTERYKNILQADQLKEPAGGFKIKSRFKHVYSECQRVYKTVDCLRNNELAELGDLINQSHNSLSEDYEVSTPEVDELVDILRANGAAGARIMGAGFGGMVLAYTSADELDHLRDQAKRLYYSRRTSANQQGFIFPCVPADGAGIL